MRAALLICAKDLRQRLRDRSAILAAIVVPLALAAVFGLVFHGVTAGRVTFELGLLDEDRGPAAQAFVREALAPLERRGLVTVRRQATLAAARRATEQGKVAATFVLPAGLSAAVEHGGPATIRVLGDVDSPIGVQVAESVARSYAAAVDDIRIAATVLGTTPTDPAALAAAAAPVSLSDVSTKDEELDPGTFYAAGMAVFFLFFTVQFGVSSILAERRDGTLARMLVAPIGRRAVLAGKVLTSVALGIVSMAVLAVGTHFLLGADWGDPLGVAILVGAGVLAATAVTALVATLARTVDQAGAWQAMVALVLGMLGGTFFPVARAGAALAKLSLLTPHAWFLRGIDDLGAGGGAGAALVPAAAMLAFAALTGSVAAARAGRLVAR